MQPIRFTLATFCGLIITAAAIAVVWNFIPALLWALIIAIIIWPVFRLLQRLFKQRSWLSALVLTLIVAVLIALPVFSILEVLIREGQVFVTFLMKIDKEGYPVPMWLSHLPYSREVIAFWQKELSHPGGLSSLLKSMHMPVNPVGSWFRQVGSSVAHWFVTLFFTLIALFFFLKEGASALAKFDALGSKHLYEHWQRYWGELTTAMVSTVNGTVMLGFAYGLLMGIAYWVLGLPSPVLAGCLTAILAMIPFGAIVISILMGVIAYIQTGWVTALVIFALGIILNAISDHVVRPLMLGNSTKLPFLAILFGILGGVELMGLLGLFLGPMIMVAFLSMWRSSTVNKD
jgi:predicted PurR-regulated permease PerM